MENKYYLPKIEEFHIGFEYEVRQHEMQYGECVYGNECETIECEGNMFLQYIDISSGNIRVKYLDSSDIESLGFKYYDKIEDSIYFKYKSFRLAFNPIVNKVEIVEFGPCHFRGSIKNKSELKVILKQIGIINE